MAEDTFERFKKVIEETVGVADAEITRDARVVDDMGFDDLDDVEVAMECEDEFGIEMGDDLCLETKETVQDWVTVIDQQRAAKAAGQAVGT